MHQSYGFQIFSDSSYIYSTKCFLFSPKCTKFVSVWGSAPDPAGGAYVQRSPRPPSWIWLGSRPAPTENFWSNPPFQNPGYGPDDVIDMTISRHKTHFIYIYLACRSIVYTLDRWFVACAYMVVRVAQSGRRHSISICRMTSLYAVTSWS